MEVNDSRVAIATNSLVFLMHANTVVVDVIALPSCKQASLLKMDSFQWHVEIANNCPLRNCEGLFDHAS